MREILFRGKRMTNGEWVVGDYQHFYLDSGKLVVYMSDWGKLTTEVDPKTVGQFTGLTDVDGTRIFEGDILRVYHPCGDVYIDNFVVEWDDLYSGWKYDTYILVGGNTKYRVMGNIYDYPELYDFEKFGVK